MSELRLYLRRDSLRDGHDCAWAHLDRGGQPLANGERLDTAPRAGLTRLVLAADLVAALPAALPDLPTRKLAPLLASAAEAHSLSPAETLHATLLGRDATGTAWLAVIDRAWLRATLDLLAARGHVADAALPESLLLPWREGEWTLLRQADGDVARFSALRVACLDHDHAAPPVGLRLALGEATPPTCLRVWRGDAAEDIDVATWQSRLGMTVVEAGIWDWRSAAWPDNAQLLGDSFAPTRGRVAWPRLGRAAAYGAALLASVQFAGVLIDWHLLAREEAALRDALRAVATQALPAHASVVDPTWQVARALQTLRASQGEDPGGFSSLLARLGQVWPEAGALKASTLDYQAGTLQVEFTATNTAWLERLQATAAAQGLAIILTSHNDGRGTLSARAAAASGTGDEHAR